MSDADAIAAAPLATTPPDTSRLAHLGLVVGLLVLVAAPFLGLYPVFVMTALCYAIFACAFNLLLGYTGLLSFGHAAYFATAAYTTGWLVRSEGWPPELGVVAGVAVAALLGLVVGFIAIRRQGIYFAMTTLALAEMTYFVFLQWRSVTGGEDGLQGVPRGKLLGVLPLAGAPHDKLFGVLPVPDDVVMYFVVLAVFIAVFLFIRRIVHSPYGQVLKAIRENEPRADLARLRRRPLQAARLRPLDRAGRPGRRAQDAGARLRDAVGRALVALGRGRPDDAARRHGHLRRAGARRVHDHRPAEPALRPRRRVGHGHHRRHLRRLRRRVPARLRRRAACVAEAPQATMSEASRRRGVASRKPTQESST